MIRKSIALFLLGFIFSTTLTSCVPAPRRISVVADSMGYYNQSAIIGQIEASGDEVVYFSSAPGTTTWTNQNLISQIKSTNNNVIVVTFGLNETRYIRGDADATPHKTLTQVLSSWSYINNLAKEYNKCLVWTSTQTQWPLNTSPTIDIIRSLNSWIRNNVVEAAWQPVIDYNILHQGGTWVGPDGFHLDGNSWGPSAYGIKIKDGVETC